MRNLCMAVIFQLGWLACVASGATGRPLAALAAAAAVVAGNLWLQRGRLAEQARLLAAVTLVGFGIETFHLWAGVFVLTGQPNYPWLCPFWLAVLWTMFATLLRGPLAWLAGRYALSALLGVAFAAPNYIAGARLGAVALGSNRLFSVTVLMASWALAMPGLVWLAAVTKAKPSQPPSANKQNVAISRQKIRRLFGAIGKLLKSPVGGKARLLLAALLILMLSINGLNVVNSYVGRYFMSAIEKRDSTGFIRYAWLYVAVFAGSTLAAAWFRYTEERLGLLWREWLTRRVIGIYMERHLYLCLGREDALSNPDQRITEDIKQLTTTTLSFVLMVLNGTITVFSFSGVLWAISPRLFVIAVIYALAGSGLAIWLGRPLVRLNYRQSDFEANFRTELIHTREEAEKIAASGAEPEVRERLNSHIDNLVKNFRHIIAVNRNLNFFTGGYNYLIQLIPVLIVAPLFIQEKVEFGVIGQSAMAFATLLGAFSLIITQFQAISSYASVVARLNELGEHAERCEIEHPQV